MGAEVGLCFFLVLNRLPTDGIYKYEVLVVYTCSTGVPDSGLFFVPRAELHPIDKNIEPSLLEFRP